MTPDIKSRCVYDYSLINRNKKVMETEIKTEGEVIDTTNDTGEGESKNDVVSIPKSDYDKLNQTLGSLKKELKDLKKSSNQDSSKETSITNTKPDETNKLVEKLERMSLRQAGITHQDDVDLAKLTAKKWNVDLDEVLVDEDFKLKLIKQQTARENVLATSNIRGSAGTSQAKNTPEYWIAKGTPPSATDVPDRKTRVKIAKAMMSNAKSSKTFYND